jgi:hypothetical protein
LNAILSITTALRNEFLFPSNLDDALIHLMIDGFVLPIALALSIRNLPLFMRLAFSPSRELFPILVSYVASVLLRLFALLEQPFVIDSALVARLVNLSAVLEGGALLVVNLWRTLHRNQEVRT